jgi:hypothetical protein
MNVTYNWGIIAHDSLDPPRRRRDLGLAATVRFANELSVPGLSGLSFLRSLVWSLVGITFAEERRKMGRPISATVIAEGIEALASWHVVQKGDTFAREQAGKTRGARKLSRLAKGQPTFASLARGRGYVTQPIRMGMGACLPRLGLVDAANSRFNSFAINDLGREFLNVALGGKAKDRLPRLWEWIIGGGEWPTNAKPEITKISPAKPLPREALSFFANVMAAADGTGADSTRAILWRSCIAVINADDSLEGDDLLRKLITKVQKQDKTAAETLFWAQAFFDVYDLAFTVLEKIERQLASPKKISVLDLAANKDVKVSIEKLRVKATALASLPGPNTDVPELGGFLADVTANEDAEILRQLVQRDGHVLWLAGEGTAMQIVLNPDHVVKNSAPDAMAEDDPPEDASRLYRLHNLCALCREVLGKP